MRAAWPRRRGRSYDAGAARAEEIVVPVQVNGKVRGRITVPVDATRGRRSARRRSQTRPCAAHVTGKTVKKVIVAQGKLVSVVVGLMDRRRFLLGLLATGAGGSVACGYALAGHGTFLPSYIETVGIPQFINTTPYYEVENVFSQDVRTEFINRGKYKIVPDATGVDALLTRRDPRASCIAPTSFTDQAQASRYIIQVTAKIEFRDMNTNKVIWDNPQWLFREEYEASAAADALDPNAFFAQEVNALDRVGTSSPSRSSARSSKRSE